MTENNAKPIPDAEKLLKAKTFKAEGNECHKSKEFRLAIGKYHRALLQLKAIGQSKSSGLNAFLSEEDMEDMGYSSRVSPDMQSEVMTLMSDCYNNLAACLLQQGNTNFSKVIEYCERVTELTPQNIKAHYRRGLGYYNLKNYEKALESYNQAASIAKNSNDQAFKTLLTKQMNLCKEGIKEQENQLKQAYKGMFNRSAVNGDKGGAGAGSGARSVPGGGAGGVPGGGAGGAPRVGAGGVPGGEAEGAPGGGAGGDAGGALGDDAGGVPGALPDINKLLQDPEILAAFQDPEVSQAFSEISQNPSSITKYQSNQKVKEVIEKLTSKFGEAVGSGGAPEGGSE